MTESDWLAGADPLAMVGWLTGDPRVRGGSNPPRVHPSARKLRLLACACCRHAWHLLVDRRSRACLEALEDEADGHDPDRAGAIVRGLEPSHAYSQRTRDMGLDGLSLSLRAKWNAADAVGLLADDISPGWPERAAGLLMSVWRAAECDRGVDPDGRRHDFSWAAPLVREVFGNPFWGTLRLIRGRLHELASAADWPAGRRPRHMAQVREEVWEPAWWLTPGVVALARGIYDRRDFALLPQLADLLEEDGCTDAPGRTVSQVVEQRRHAVMGGCCDRFADRQACNCLETAAPDGLLAHLRSPGPHARGCWALDLVLGKE